jgi:hypothetical protein
LAAVSDVEIVDTCASPGICRESNEAAAPANAEPRNPRRDNGPDALFFAIKIPSQIMRDL